MHSVGVEEEWTINELFIVYYWMWDLWVFLECMVHTWKNVSSNRATWVIWNLQLNTEKF
jgi:hypothetical protein